MRRPWNFSSICRCVIRVHHHEIDSLRAASGRAAGKCANYELSHMSTCLDQNLSSCVLRAPACSCNITYNMATTKVTPSSRGTAREYNRLASSKKSIDSIKGQRLLREEHTYSILTTQLKGPRSAADDQRRYISYYTVHKIHHFYLCLNY